MQCYPDFILYEVYVFHVEKVEPDINRTLACQLPGQLNHVIVRRQPTACFTCFC